MNTEVEIKAQTLKTCTFRDLRAGAIFKWVDSNMRVPCLSDGYAAGIKIDATTWYSLEENRSREVEGKDAGDTVIVLHLDKVILSPA